MQYDKWTKNDQEKLIQVVEAHTKNNRVKWKEVAIIMQKSSNKCKTFYRNVLRKNDLPKVNQQFTQEEEELIGKFVQIYGKQWNLLQQYFLPHRSVRSIRLKYNYMSKQCKHLKEIFHQIVNIQNINEQIIKSLANKQKHLLLEQIKKYNIFINQTEERIRSSQGFIMSKVEPIDFLFYEKFQNQKIRDAIDYILKILNNDDTLTTL